MSIFKTFDRDLTYMPKVKFSVKYTFPFFISAFSLMLAGQLIIQFFTVRQLNKATGNITRMEYKIDYWTHNKGSMHSYAVYSLFITLDNRHTFNVENEEYMAKLDKILRRGDNITVYYPTLTYQILTFGFFHKVNQVELGDQVIYSFSEEKKEAWVIVAVAIFGLSLFSVIMYYLRKYVI